jgi:hypothetical protein
VASAAARDWAAVTATGSRPGSRRACATVNEAEKSSDAEIKPPSPLPLSPTPAVTARARAS